MNLPSNSPWSFVSNQLISLASREDFDEESVLGECVPKVSNQLISLASREFIEFKDKEWGLEVSNQLISLASREALVCPRTPVLALGFQSINFPSE